MDIEPSTINTIIGIVILVVLFTTFFSISFDVTFSYPKKKCDTTSRQSTTFAVGY